MSIKIVATKSEFDHTLTNEKRLVVIDFYATWCGPCKNMAPVLEEWAKKYTDVVFLKIDVDENDETAEQCGVTAMPTFILYKAEEKVATIVGANKEKLLEAILAHK